MIVTMMMTIEITDYETVVSKKVIIRIMIEMMMTK
jgi:hypothetical protein